MKSVIVDISKEELRTILLGGTGLYEWQGRGENGIREVFDKQRMVQLDPLNPAGRNHDLFFSSRVSDYKVGQFEKLMYPEKMVFEAYSPNLFAIHIEHYPAYRSRMNEEHLHSSYKTRIKKVEAAHPGIFDQVFQFVAEHGPTQSSDLAHLGTIDPNYAMWRSGRIAGIALETLWLQAKLIIAKRDENFRKVFDLVERYVDSKFLIDLDMTEDNYYREIFRVKQKSYPLLPLGRVSTTKTGKIRLGRSKRLSATWFEDDGFATILQLKEENIGVAAPTNWEEMTNMKPDGEMRALGPLDPIIYDREITKAIFNFDYAWEVYKKPQDRIWGYYVFPLLYEGRLIGRMEAKYEKKSKNLSFFNLNLEKGVELDNRGEGAFCRLLERWQNMLGAEESGTDNTFPVST